MSFARGSPHRYAIALCLGLAFANLTRASLVIALGAVVMVAATAVVAGEDALPSLACLALALVGWWWGSARLEALDASVLLAHVDTSERSWLVVTGPVSRSRFEPRAPARTRRFGRLRFREAVLLELPLGRSPPQGRPLRAVHTRPPP